VPTTRHFFTFPLILLPLSACATSHQTITIATDAAFHPFHYIDDNGNITGHDIELAKLAVTQAGYTPKVIQIRPYAELLKGLQQGKYQMVAATTGITPERQRTFLFSTPYFTTCQAVLVRKGQNEPDTLADLDGRPVGYAGSGTSARAAKNMTRVTPIQLGKGQQGIPTLLAGEVDALIVDEFEAVAAAGENPSQLKVLREPAAIEQYAFVFNRNAHHLRNQINTALKSLRDSAQSKNLQSHFNLTRNESWPVNVNTDP
jgi:polar amino acid transport system substrate-binding protein